MALVTGYNLAPGEPLGVLGMQERVRLVNGQFAIESAPKRGTTVRVQVPLPSAELPAAAESTAPLTVPQTNN